MGKEHTILKEVLNIQDYLTKIRKADQENLNLKTEPILKETEKLTNLKDKEL